MATFWYDHGSTLLAEASISWPNDDFLLDLGNRSGYTADPSHTTRAGSSVPAASLTTYTMTSADHKVTIEPRIIDADDVTTAAFTGTVNFLTLTHKDTDVLLLYADLAGDVTKAAAAAALAWSSGSTRIGQY
jgi:hypothetical protein